MTQVSVITPCYNSARYVAQTIAGVRAQNGVTWEHILVDDGSTDDTADVIRSQLPLDARTRLVERPNRGVAAARNEGYRAASPDSTYLLFLDSDDWLEPGMLARMVEYLDRRPEAGVAFCDPILVDADGGELDKAWPARPEPLGAGITMIDRSEPVTPFESVYLLAGIIPSLALIRRSTYLRTPGWDESFGQPCEDTDLFLHLALQAEIHFVPERLANHRIHAGQSVRDLDRLDRQRIKLYEKWQAMATEPGPLGKRIVAAHRLFRRAQLGNRLGQARRLLREGRPLIAARYAVGAARRYVLPPTGTAEAAGRSARTRRTPYGPQGWAA